MLDIIRFQAAIDQNLPTQLTELIKNGMDVNIVDPYGMTPLHHAQHVQIVEVLLEYGANIHATDNQGRTPLNYEKAPEIMKMLQEAAQKEAPITATTTSTDNLTNINNPLLDSTPREYNKPPCLLGAAEKDVDDQDA